MTISPVKIVDAVVRDGDLFLLVQTRKVQAYGRWSFPGGHVEPGETNSDAIRRELKEELSVSVTSLKPIKDSLTTAQDETTHPVTISAKTYLAEVYGKIKLDPKELMDYRWVTLAEAKQMRGQLRSSWIIPVLESLS